MACVDFFENRYLLAIKKGKFITLTFHFSLFTFHFSLL